MLEERENIQLIVFLLFFVAVYYASYMLWLESSDSSWGNVHLLQEIIEILVTFRFGVGQLFLGSLSSIL